MATLLVIGALPSGLASIVTTAQGLYIARFFIGEHISLTWISSDLTCIRSGILGGTFVPCQAWTTAFFDKKVVGRANSLVGGWGNSGGEYLSHLD